MQCVLLLALAVVLHAYSEFRYKIPNGFEVKNVPAVGHANKIGGGDAYSSFGEDFIDAGYAWTKELCLLDSDGDGATNGEELGDPCCMWNEIEDDSPLRMSDLTSPGHANTFTAEQLQGIRCQMKEDL